jgi:hypothetical protein
MQWWENNWFVDGVEVEIGGIFGSFERFLLDFELLPKMDVNLFR